MSNWIDLGTLAKIVVAALLFGAGLPALFGLGLRALGRERTGGGGTAAVTVRPAALALAVLCFAVVAAAVGYGIYLIVAGT